VALIEESCNLIALLEFNDLGSHFDDLTRAIRAWHYGQTESKWIHALWEKLELGYGIVALRRQLN
jgi:hypothetical protein